MKQNKTVKLMAILAMLGIIISVVWTGLLIIFEQSRAPQQLELTAEEIEELQKQIQESMSGSTSTGSTATGSLEIEESSK